MVYQVKPKILIERLTEELKEKESIKAPEWSKHVKTGVSRERTPQNEDWWHRRAASLLRKLYIDSPRGVRKLAKSYGAKGSSGSQPSHKVNGSRKVIRVILKQLEEEGLVEKSEKGRNLTPEGRSFLYNLSKELD